MAERDGEPSTPESLLLLAEEVVLDLPAVEAVLLDAARAAAASVALSCGITYVARYGVFTVASSDERASAVDEIQYGTGDGPCLEALRTRTAVRVEDLATDDRWPAYRGLAIQAGVGSSLSLPLMVEDQSVGALNVYSTEPGPWPADLEAAVMLVGIQTAGILQGVRDLAADLLQDPKQAQHFQAQHELDIAVGIVMVQRNCSGTEARAALLERARAEEVATPVIVARILASGSMDAEP